MTAVLLQEISQILLLPSIPRELIRQSLAQILIRYQQEQFNSPNSRSELFRTVSGASHLLGDVLPHVLDMLRRGSKGFATEVRKLSIPVTMEMCYFADGFLLTPVDGERERSSIATVEQDLCHVPARGIA